MCLWRPGGALPAPTEIIVAPGAALSEGAEADVARFVTTRTIPSWSQILRTTVCV